MWDPPKRNFDRIEHEKLRKEVDGKFNDLHDELSDCFYNKNPYKTYGILTKEQFDKLHGLIFLMRDIDFHEQNKKQSLEDIIPEEKYNDMKDEAGNPVKKDQIAKKKISDLKKEGFEIKMEE